MRKVYLGFPAAVSVKGHTLAAYMSCPKVQLVKGSGAVLDGVGTG